MDQYSMIMCVCGMFAACIGSIIVLSMHVSNKLDENRKETNEKLDENRKETSDYSLA